MTHLSKEEEYLILRLYSFMDLCAGGYETLAELPALLRELKKSSRYQGDKTPLEIIQNWQKQGLWETEIPIVSGGFTKKGLEMVQGVLSIKHGNRVEVNKDATYQGILHAKTNQVSKKMQDIEAIKNKIQEDLQDGLIVVVHDISELTEEENETLTSSQSSLKA